MFYWHQRIEPAGRAYGVEWGFTDRWGGSSQGSYAELNLGRHVGDLDDAVDTNRHRLAHELGLRLTDLRFMDQQHGCAVAVTPGTDEDQPAAWQWQEGSGPSVDGIVSGRDDEALVVMVADCTPVLLVDRAEGLAAAVHAGRPGMVAGVVPATIARMRELGAQALEAVVGPSICARCYEVPAQMRDDAAAVEPAAAGTSWTGTPAIDVAAAVVAQLARHDVALTWLGGCTREDTNLFSYRRDGSTGRFAGVVRLLAPERAA